MKARISKLSQGRQNKGWWVLTEYPEKPVKQMNSDSKNRIKLQERIRELIISGESKNSILEILEVEFPNSELKMFFETYIDNWLKNLNKVRDDGDER